jgi:hypothetical protein
MYVSGTQTQLTATLFQKKCPLKRGCSSRTIGRTIRRTVINHQHMKILLQVVNGLQDLFNIFPFVVGRNNNQFLHGLSLCVFSA